jgi:hypothetical protein
MNMPCRRSELCQTSIIPDLAIKQEGACFAGGGRLVGEPVPRHEGATVPFIDLGMLPETATPAAGIDIRLDLPGGILQSPLVDVPQRAAELPAERMHELIPRR